MIIHARAYFAMVCTPALLRSMYSVAPVSDAATIVGINGQCFLVRGGRGGIRAATSAAASPCT